MLDPCQEVTEALGMGVVLGCVGVVLGGCWGCVGFGGGGEGGVAGWRGDWFLSFLVLQSLPGLSWLQAAF